MTTQLERRIAEIKRTTKAMFTSRDDLIRHIAAQDDESASLDINKALQNPGLYPELVLKKHRPQSSGGGDPLYPERG